MKGVASVVADIGLVVHRLGHRKRVVLRLVTAWYVL